MLLFLCDKLYLRFIYFTIKILKEPCLYWESYRKFSYPFSNKWRYQIAAFRIIEGYLKIGCIKSSNLL